jgi:hypothetical protein
MSFVQSHASGAQQLHPMAHPWRGVVDCRDWFRDRDQASSLRERAMNTSGRELEITTLLLARHFDKQLRSWSFKRTVVYPNLPRLAFPSMHRVKCENY